MYVCQRLLRFSKLAFNNMTHMGIFHIITFSVFCRLQITIRIGTKPRAPLKRDAGASGVHNNEVMIVEQTPLWPSEARRTAINQMKRRKT